MISTLVVDDHPAICFAVKAILEQNGKFDVHTVSDGMSAVAAIKTQNPQLLILDIGLTKMDGLEILSRIQNYHSETKVIILTGLNTELYAERVFKLGAAGFLCKDDDISKLAMISELVMMGYCCFPESVIKPARHVENKVENQDKMTKLSDRELTVLRYLSEGMSNKEIADRLLLSNKTISTYKTRLFEKLGIKDITELNQFQPQDLNVLSGS